MSNVQSTQDKKNDQKENIIIKKAIGWTVNLKITVENVFSWEEGTLKNPVFLFIRLTDFKVPNRVWKTINKSDKILWFFFYSFFEMNEFD